MREAIRDIDRLQQQSFTILLALLINILGLEAMAHDIEVANDDGVTTPGFFASPGDCCYL